MTQIIVRILAIGLTVAATCGCQSTFATDVIDLPTTMVSVFATQRHYQLRTEPEETVPGYLYRVDIGTGPNTRDLAIRIRTDQGDWGVYTEGIDDEFLDQYLDQPIVVRAKWVDLSVDGFATEVWIGSIGLE